jgi:hypothetical protein
MKIRAHRLRARVLLAAVIGMSAGWLSPSASTDRSQPGRGVTTVTESREIDRLIAAARALEEQTGDLTWTGELFANQVFRELYAAAEANYMHVISVLKRNDVNARQKLILALSVQSLPLDQRVKFSSHLLDLLSAGEISNTIFNQAVFPSYDWSTTLPENYGDPRVRSLLAAVTQSGAVDPAIREFVANHILTGKAQAQIEELRDAGQLR